VVRRLVASTGVCLARSIAQSRSLEGFRSLWIDEGSILVLVERHLPHLGGLWGREGALDSLRHMIGERMHEEGVIGAPLNGNKMCELLHEAFEGMTKLADPTPATLLPDGGNVELLVTTTDLGGYDVLVTTGTGGVSNSHKSYRQVLRFLAPNGGVDDFEGEGAVEALTFAARATSSFPGAFPPVSLKTFQAALGTVSKAPTHDSSEITRHFVYGTDYGVRPDRAWYVDGGVLDNAPFDDVVAAIATKRAELETARQLIYIQPDPGHGPIPNTSTPPEPSWLKTVHESLSTIPKHKPTIDALEGLRTMNERIEEIGKIADTQSSDLLAALKTTTTIDVSYHESLDAAGDVRKFVRDRGGTDVRFQLPPAGRHCGTNLRRGPVSQSRIPARQQRSGVCQRRPHRVGPGDEPVETAGVRRAGERSDPR
jgi:patatin-related protein